METSDAICREHNTFRPEGLGALECLRWRALLKGTGSPVIGTEHLTMVSPHKLGSSGGSHKKGRALEERFAAIVRTEPGMRIIGSNARLAAEEIDLIVGIDDSSGKLLPCSVLVVECKNWKGRVGAEQVNGLAGRMEALSPDVRLGLLVAPNGVTGKQHGHDAQQRRREYRQKSLYILVFDAADLDILERGSGLFEMIVKKYRELYLI